MWRFSRAKHSSWALSACAASLTAVRLKHGTDVPAPIAQPICFATLEAENSPKAIPIRASSVLKAATDEIDIAEQSKGVYAYLLSTSQDFAVGSEPYTRRGEEFRETWAAFQNNRTTRAHSSQGSFTRASKTIRIVVIADFLRERNHKGVESYTDDFQKLYGEFLCTPPEDSERREYHVEFDYVSLGGRPRRSKTAQGAMLVDQESWERDASVSFFDSVEQFAAYAKTVDIFLFPGGVPFLAKSRLLGVYYTFYANHYESLLTEQSNNPDKAQLETAMRQMKTATSFTNVDNSAYLSTIRDVIWDGQSMLVALSAGLIFVGDTLQTTETQWRVNKRRDGDTYEKYFSNNDIERAKQLTGLQLFPGLSFRPHMMYHNRADYTDLQQLLSESSFEVSQTVQRMTWGNIQPCEESGYATLIKYLVHQRHDGVRAGVAVLTDGDILVSRGNGKLKIVRAKTRAGKNAADDFSPSNLWYVDDNRRFYSQ